jgi:hypothetical protein
MSLIFCLVVDSMIRAKGKHHVLSCFVLDLGGSRGISLCPHSPIYPITPSKSIFGITEGKLLGHIVSYSGRRIDLERIVAILNLPAPTSKKEVQAFMGVIKFVCRFVLDFVVMVKPIHNILKQDHSFSCTNGIENAFEGIKKEIISASVLMKSYVEKEFTIYTNATEEAISAILMQNDDQGNEKPVSYMSQSLYDDEFKYSFY